MIPSKYQLDIYNAVKTTNKSIVINAKPGSGKSFSIIECAKLIPNYKKVIFLAFNKAIVEELAKKLPSHITVSTLHSFGCKALYRAYRGKVKVNEYKTLKFSTPFLRKWGIKEKDKLNYQFVLQRLIDLYRMNLVKSKEHLQELAIKHDVLCVGEEITHALELMQHLTSYNVNNIGKGEDRVEIDFTDMIYLPAINNQIKLDQFDVVEVDESQDLSVAQQSLVEKLIKPGGRAIYCGDPFQSIYSFSGSSPEVFDKLTQRPNTITLPLSISYRCAKSVVRKAQEIYPEIEAYEDNIEGEVRDGTIFEIEKDDFVLCRNNRPLIALYFELIGQGKKCYVKGRDLGKGLVALLSKIKHLSNDHGVQELFTMLDKVIETLAVRGIHKPENHPQYVNLMEKISIIEFLLTKYATLSDVSVALEKIFSEEGDGTALMSIHKSKGLENKRVFVIRPDLLGGNKKYITQEWQKVEEKNIVFVCYTRSKESLIFIRDWSDE